MPATVNVHDAKTHLSRLLDRAHAGEEIIIAKAGKPYARLVKLDEPAKPKPLRTPGGWPELAAVPDDVWLEPVMTDADWQAWDKKFDDL
ncbi:MAG: type II toxin-antitoxin system prevent-host-death family antitoxin [Alphaproteobacteria bacterium]|nr:type II toxin-antitoxin system prevent-host-death family antitoxin [Alphaproteobacteria bacterium]